MEICFLNGKNKEDSSQKCQGNLYKPPSFLMETVPRYDLIY